MYYNTLQNSYFQVNRVCIGYNGRNQKPRFQTFQVNLNTETTVSTLEQLYDEFQETLETQEKPFQKQGICQMCQKSEMF